MMSKISKWGNSLGLRIPRSAAQELGIEGGSEVEISTSEGSLIVTPSVRRRYRLSQLVADIRPSNLHGEADFGEPAGGEAL